MWWRNVLVLVVVECGGFVGGGVKMRVKGNIRRRRKEEEEEEERGGGGGGKRRRRRKEEEEEEEEEVLYNVSFDLDFIKIHP